MKERAIYRTVVLFLGIAASTPALVRADYSEQEFARFTSARDARIDNIRDKEIKQLLLILSRNIPREQNPDMLLRLAELYTEKYKLYFMRETEIWQSKMDLYLQHNIEEQKSAKNRPSIDNGASRKWLVKAVTVLDRILGIDRAYRRIDEVHYFLGFNTWELGKKPEAIRYFKLLVEKTPNSRFAPEAYRYIADYSFGQRDFNKARTFYQKAATYETPAKARILYGLAWTNFKLKKYKDATETMRQAIERAKGQGTDAQAQGIALQRDAYDALALFYTESEEAEKAGAYFSQLLGRQSSVDVLRKLAATYQRQGRFSKALIVNKQLVDLGGEAQRTGDEQRFSILLDSVRVAGNSNDRDREASLIKTMVAEFVVKSQFANSDRNEQIRLLIRKAALLAHQEANKSPDPKPIFARAEDLYRVYLSAFGGRLSSQEIWETRYFLADTYAQQNKHSQAANEFQLILSAAEKNPQEPILQKYKKESAVGVILSLDAILKMDKQAWTVEEANQLIAAVDTFSRLFPKEKDVTKYMARAAGVLVTSKRMAEARPRLEALVKTYPSSKEGLDAAVLLVKDADETQAWERARTLSETFLGNATLMAQDKNGELRQQLEGVRSRSKFKEVKVLEEEQDFATAAIEYEQLAKQTKDREIRYKALNNAAVSYQKASDRKNELRVYQELIRDYPKDDRPGKALLESGNRAFLEGDLAVAAAYFEAIYLGHSSILTKVTAPRQELVMNSIKNASFLREALGQKAEAAEDLRNIVDAANRNIPSARLVAEEILARAAERMRVSGDRVEALRAYQKYVQSFPQGRFVIEAHLFSGILYEELRDDEKAKASYNRSVQILRQKGKVAGEKEISAGAQARLMLIKKAESDFFRLPMRLPESQLKLDISAKLKAMDELVKGYVEVVDIGDGTWGVEALRHMAEAYQHFGQSLESAPVPEEFSPEDKAKFRASLKQIAGPVFLKRDETIENALKTGESLFVAGPGMARIYLNAALASARADRLPLAYTLDWSNPEEWLAGYIPRNEADLMEKRKELRLQPENANAWVAIGNWHCKEAKFELARVFYLRALETNKKAVNALANLAYLEGRSNQWQRALAGLRSALEFDEFATQPKKNLARIYMASGLWRHANLALRQLEIRVPTDLEVKHALGLSYLANGKHQQAEPLLTDYLVRNDVNARFAKAIMALAKGSSVDARTQIELISSQNEYAALVLRNWKP